jgi:hypothetical protein
MLFFMDTCNSASEAGIDGITVFWSLTLADRLEVPAILTNFVSKLISDNDEFYLTKVILDIYK